MSKAKAIKTQQNPQTSKLDLLFAKANEEWDSGRTRSAFRLFLSAAKLGEPGAQHNLGYFYDVGIGVKANRTAALYWYRRAYRHGYRVAASNIATMYRDENKIKRALEWFHRAIRLGDADANLEIAKILLQQERGATKAIGYLKRTIESNASDVTEGSRQEAQNLLKSLLREGDPAKTKR